MNVSSKFHHSTIFKQYQCENDLFILSFFILIWHSSLFIWLATCFLKGAALKTLIWSNYYTTLIWYDLIIILLWYLMTVTQTQCFFSYNYEKLCIKLGITRFCAAPALKLEDYVCPPPPQKKFLVNREF